MICRYRLKLKLQEGRIPQFWAYRLYAWLLTKLPEEQAQNLHEQEKRTLSQYLDHEIWYVTLFGEETIEAVTPVLEAAREIDLHTDRITILECTCDRVDGAQFFLHAGKQILSKRTELQIISPMSFKQSGRYTIFPKEELLIQSLLTRWNEVFPEFLLNDPEMEEVLLQGIHIVDYSLRTSRYQLKNSAIPSFYGKIFLEVRLPVVLQELWNALLCFSCYSGIGMKTTLGMGGVQISAFPKERSNL